MKLFDYATYEDYGKEWYFQVLPYYPHFTLFDIRWQWDEFPATEIFPFFIFSIGAHSLCGFSFRWKWFELRVDFIQTQPRNLEWLHWRAEQPETLEELSHSSIEEG
jgi:hypothetical protein